jgi:hypothetical protein
MRPALLILTLLSSCATAPATVEERSSPGELSQSDIRRTIQEHLPELQDCSNRFQRLKPGTHGKLLVQFHVLPSGETGDVSARGENAPMELGACVTEVFRVMRFKEHRGDPELVLWPMKY